MTFLWQIIEAVHPGVGGDVTCHFGANNSPPDVAPDLLPVRSRKLRSTTRLIAGRKPRCHLELWKSFNQNDFSECFDTSTFNPEAFQPVVVEDFEIKPIVWTELSSEKCGSQKEDQVICDTGETDETLETEPSLCETQGDNQLAAEFCFGGTQRHLWMMSSM